ncbi:MAG: hypothetical protein J2P36_14065 [Ktedonobacteraceae bacterium]|nr:hypothetical protein [Ktedonobacteraceae bacterium]
MSEARAAYTVHTQPKSASDPHSLVQMPDTILLMTERYSTAIPGETALPCMHLAHDAQGRLGYCNAEMDRLCVGCGRPVCAAHWSEQSMVLYDERTYQYDTFPMCVQCALLPHEHLYALRTLRLQINSQQE